MDKFKQELREMRKGFDSIVKKELRKYDIQLPKDSDRVEIVRQVTMNRGIEPAYECYIDGKHAFTIYQRTTVDFKGSGLSKMEIEYFIQNQVGKVE